MASIRQSINVYAVILMLLHRVAYSLQEDTDTKMVVMSRDKNLKERTMLSRHEKDHVYHGVEMVEKRKILGVRKIMKKVNKEHINGEEIASKIASSSSATPKNGVHKLPKITKKMHHHYDDDVKVKMSSNYMALNADYHVPRSHPPKNN